MANICNNCGCPVKPEDMFCENCGAKLSKDDVVANDKVSGNQIDNNQVSNQTSNQMNNQIPNQFNNNINPVKKNKKPMAKKTKILISVIALLIVIAGGVGYYLYNRPVKIDIKKYVTVDFEGYDTIGTGEAKLKNDKLNKAILAKSKKIDDDVLKSEEQLEIIKSCITMKLNKSENLSNGDKVVLSFKFDNEIARKYGVEFKGKPITYTVKSLDEVKEVDPFASVEITYDGIAPDIEATLENTTDDEVLKNLEFEMSKSEGLSKGDEITVSITNEEDFLEEYGYKLMRLETTYVVKAVTEYVEKVSDISDKEMKKLKKQAKDEIIAYSTSNSDDFIVDNVKYLGNYYLTKKGTTELYSGTNYIDLIYSARISEVPDEEYYEFGEKTIYFAVEFSDLMKLPSGKIEYDRSDPLQGNSSIEDGPYFSGYTSIEEMYDELVGSHVDDYKTSMEGNLRK